MFTRVLQEQPQDWLDERGDVDLKLLSHGLYYLLYQQDNGVLDRRGRAPEFLVEKELQLVRS